MKSVKYYAVAAALVSSLLSPAAHSQGQASFNKAGAGSQATCTYSGLTIINGNLDVTCSTDVVYTGTSGGGGTGTGPYALTVTVSPSGAGTVGGALCATGSTGSCNGSVPASSPTSVTATAATGYTFQNWSGGPCAGSTNAVCSWTMTGAITMAANFQSTSSGGGGGGTVPAGCSGLTPTSNYELKATLGPSNQSTRHTGVQGTIYAFPLPTTRGLFATSTTVYTPGSLAVEVAISQCPGDMNYYKTAPAMVSLWGVAQTPCGGVFGAESGGVNWSTVNSPYQALCLTSTTTPQWYINLRFLNGTCPTGTCEIYYTWSQ